MTEKDLINQITGSKHIAIAGVSSNPKKSGSVLFKELKNKDYQVYGINPNLEEIDGDKCYASVKDVPGKVEAVVIVTKPENTLKIVAEVAEKGISAIWMQLGSESKEAIELAENNNIKVVSKRCIFMFVEPVAGIHNFHRFVTKLFRTYPN